MTQNTYPHTTSSSGEYVNYPGATQLAREASCFCRLTLLPLDGNVTMMLLTSSRDTTPAALHNTDVTPVEMVGKTSDEQLTKHKVDELS